MPKWLRSTVSVFVGFVVFYALQGGCTFFASRVLHLSYDQPTSGFIAATIIYTLLAALIGGYVAARVAPSHPFGHGVGVAVLMVPLAVMSLNKGFGSQETASVVVRSVGMLVFAVVGAALDSARHKNQYL